MARARTNHQHVTRTAGGTFLAKHDLAKSSATTIIDACAQAVMGENTFHPLESVPLFRAILISVNQSSQTQNSPIGNLMPINKSRKQAIDRAIE